MNNSIMMDIRDSLMKGDRDRVVRLTGEAMDAGIEIRRILDEGLISAMEVIGKRFKANEIFIPEVLISARAMHAGVAILEPHFVKFGIKPIGRVVIGTVKGDLHDIGKNIVSMMLKGACFDIQDFGIDVPPKKFVDAVKDGEVDILAMSSLLTTSMPFMKETVIALKEAGLRDKVKIMVGGAPVTQDFADSIGADCFARDAASAVDRAKELLRARV